MPYPPRVCFEGAIYHVTMRGNNREAVFGDDQDYQEYLRRLSAYQRRLPFTLHAYALMPNHVHLLIAPAATATISRIMQCQTIAYTKYFNRRYQHSGHVFQGRFHSRLIKDDLYLLVASRYVHLNPVRAKLVGAPLDYRWSSYRAYQEPSKEAFPLVDPTLVLSIAGGGKTARWEAYRTFVEDPLVPILERIEAAGTWL